MAEINKELISFLQGKVDAWLEERSSRSISSLSRMTGIPHSTLRRILQGETSYSFDQVLAVLERTCEPSEITESIKKFFPSVLSLLGRAYEKKNIDSNFSNIDSDAKQFFKDPDTFPLMALASRVNGVSKEYVQRMYGENGLAKLNFLAENEIISEISDGNYRFENDWVSSDSTVLLSMAANAAKLFQGSEFNKHFVFSWIENVSKDAAGEIQDIVNDAESKIYQIVNSEQNKGDIPISCNVVLGRLDHD